MMDLAIGKEAGQREVAQCVMYHLYLFGIIPELFTTTSETGYIEATSGFVIQSCCDVIQHMLHIIDGGLFVTLTKDYLVTLAQIIVDREDVVIGINTDEVTHGVIALVTVRLYTAR